MSVLAEKMILREKTQSPIEGEPTVSAKPLTSLEPDCGPVTVADARKTKRIMRKIDIHLLPICSLLYLFSFLDRSAIGNARVAGMNAELKLTYPQYAWALSMFFVTYGLLEVPSNLMTKRFGAKIWLPIIMVLWGLAMALSGTVENFAGLLALRMLLGAFEAGLFPSVVTLLSFLYPSEHMQVRIGIFFTASTIAGSFGGLLAYAVSHIKTGSYSGWRWIFIIEGLLTMVTGAVSYFFLVSTLDTANFLTEDEKQYMSDRIRFDGKEIPMNDDFEGRFIRAGLTDWKTWLTFFATVGSTGGCLSVALTLPTLLHVSLGYGAIKTQLMTVPVYAVAAVLTLMFAWASDKLQNRSLFFCLGSGIATIGWGIGLSSHVPHIRYAASFVSAMGSYSAVPCLITLVSQNTGGQTKRAVGIALQVGLAGLCGIMASNIFPPEDAPHFTRGYTVNCSLSGVALLCGVGYSGLLRLANQRKQGRVDSGEAARLSRQEIADLGDCSPYFRYKY